MRAVREDQVGQAFDTEVETPLYVVGSSRLLESMRGRLIDILQGGKLPKEAPCDGLFREGSSKRRLHVMDSSGWTLQGWKLQKEAPCNGLFREGSFLPEKSLRGSLLLELSSLTSPLQGASSGSYPL